MRLRTWLFDRGDNLAGGIYGTILVISLIAAVDFKHRIWQSIALIELTTFVFWLAHVYAFALATSLERQARVSLREVRTLAAHEWPLLQSSILPLLALIAGGIGLLAVHTAFTVAIGIGVVTLASWGFVFARKERLGALATTGVVATNTAFGLVVVALKVFVSH
jgi:hypothetical protein